MIPDIDSQSHKTTSPDHQSTWVHCEPVTACAHLEVSSDPVELDRLRDFVRHVCMELTGPALDETGTWEFQLAATEAASNIMRHAYHGERDRRITVEADISDGRVCIQLSHDGERFDPQPVVEPTLGISTAGGFGRFIMQQVLDDVVHTQDGDNRQLTTLIKNRRSSNTEPK